MKLIVDIGNTNSVYAILDGNNYVYKQRLSPNENIKNIINEISNYNLDFIAIASVVPKQTKFHIDAFQKQALRAGTDMEINLYPKSEIQELIN